MTQVKFGQQSNLTIVRWEVPKFEEIDFAGLATDCGAQAALLSKERSKWNWDLFAACTEEVCDRITANLDYGPKPVE